VRRLSSLLSYPSSHSKPFLDESRQEASGDKQAEVAAITARVEELESNLVASRTSAEEHKVSPRTSPSPTRELTICPTLFKARACQLEKVIAEIEAGRDEAVVRLRAQLSEQEAAVREERQLVCRLQEQVGKMVAC
jgi:hypothetical protein